MRGLPVLDLWHPCYFKRVLRILAITKLAVERHSGRSEGAAGHSELAGRKGKLLGVFAPSSLPIGS